MPEREGPRGRRPLRGKAPLARDYYRGIASEIRRKLERRRPEREEREAEIQRIRATEAELSRKLAGLVERYRLSLRLRPVALERAIAPALTVLRKDKVRRLALVWNPILKDLEPLPCDACGTPIWSFSACREAVHLLCGKCSRQCPACGKAACPACRPRACCSP